MRIFLSLGGHCQIAKNHANFDSSISGQSTVCNLDISLLWTARLFEAHKVQRGFFRTLVSFGNGPHFAEACDGNDLLCKRSNDTCEHFQRQRLSI